jgi:hypothetical protein
MESANPVFYRSSGAPAWHDNITEELQHTLLIILNVKVSAGEGQAVDNPLYNNIIRSDSLKVDEHVSCI